MNRRTMSLRLSRLNQVSNAQRKFLFDVRDNPQTLDQVVQRMMIQPWQISKWMRTTRFRQALAETVRGLRKVRKLELEMAARQATHVMSQILAGVETSHVKRQASFDVLDLAFTYLRPKRREIRKKLKEAAATRRLNLNLQHPDNSDEETYRLLDIMEGRQPSD
jgi:hypothetical protein